jgi:hypothetical protein
MVELESPIKMDMIEFCNWSNNKLLIMCDEFLNCNRVELELDCETFNIAIKSRRLRRICNCNKSIL